jgi:hypothetical protein
MKTRNSILDALALLSAFCLQPSAFGQGSLTPPSPPGPTMLTLNQLEPRTPVDAVHTPGNGSAEFVITNPGSYYLTANIIGVSGEDGIDIDTNNVTLDLNGFSLLGNPGSPLGINIAGGITNITVHGGVISGWGGGYANGIDNSAYNTIFESLTISFCYYGLICDGNSATIRNCVLNNNVDAGIYIENGTAIVTGCLMNNNFYGIDIAGSGCLITGNDCAGSAEAGIFCGGSNNRIDDNHVTSTNAAQGGIIGSGSGGSVIIRNTVDGSGVKDFYFYATQITGPIITNTISGIITNSNPWANFAF